MDKWSVASYQLAVSGPHWTAAPGIFTWVPIYRREIFQFASSSYRVIQKYFY